MLASSIFMRYFNMTDPSDGIAELYDKGLLAKTKDLTHIQ